MIVALEQHGSCRCQRGRHERATSRLSAQAGREILCFYEENFRECGKKKVTPKRCLARRTAATPRKGTGGKGTRPPHRPRPEAIERRRLCEARSDPIHAT